MADAGVIIFNAHNWIINNMTITVMEALLSAIFFVLQIFTLGLIVYIWQSKVRKQEETERDVKEVKTELNDIKYNYLDRFDKVNVNITAITVKVDNALDSLEYIKSRIDRKDN